VLEDDRRTPLSEGWGIKQNTGMMIVVPAWKLAELLDDEGLVEMREDEGRGQEQ
jgi:hypothetical protein